MNKTHCDSCGKDLRTKKGATMVAVQYTLSIDENTSEDDLEYYKKQWGKYFSPDGVQIRLCIECLIDSAFSNHNPYL